MHRAVHLLAFALALTLLSACQTTGMRFLNLVGLDKEPVVMALVADRQPGGPGPLDALNPFPKYKGLQDALRKDIDRPVGVDLCFPIQVEPNLNNGLYQLAVLSPIQYGRLQQRDHYAPLAVPKDFRGRAARPALLIVRHDAVIQHVADVRGSKVVFGPTEEPRTHHGALELLARHGITPKDLDLEVLPLPGSLKHATDVNGLLRSILNGHSAAGFIDLADWEKLPEHDEPGAVAQDQYRIIARTRALPSRVVIASPKLDAQMRARVTDFLLDIHQTNPVALQPLGISGYAQPTEDMLAACVAVAHPGAARE